ncbi:hypothetical protein R1flu_000753 [Riccia fluitans]|uniref:Peroxisomal membrane protein 2 n=1 Tax=Riccia fluitans TaxID=41844 RepID=A0ABD1Y1B0_9MARC
MATLANSMNTVVIGGIPQLPVSRDPQPRGGCRAVNSEATARALSGKFCSSSGAFSRPRGLSWVSQTSPKPSVRCAGVSDGKSSDRLTFSSPAPSVEGVSAGQIQRSRSGLNAFSDEVDAVAQDIIQDISGLAELEIPRPQQIVQGFAEKGFEGSLAMVDLNSHAPAAPAGSEVFAASMTMYQPKYVWFARTAEEENIFIDRFINATIVGSAGLFALTKMFTIDRDYWHGWTLLEIIRYAPVHNWFAYEELLQTHPVLAKMAISGTVYSLGDWIAQCVEGKGPLEFNRTRMLRSGLVGFGLHGSLSHFYYHFCEWLFPFQGWWVVPLKVAFDQTIWSGFWNSIYFIMVGLLRFESPRTILKELKETFFPLLTAGWKLWPFAHIITYGFIPLEQRLLWVDMVEIVWVTILAMYSNQNSEARIAEGETKEVLKDAAVATVSIDEVSSASVGQKGSES